MIKNDKFDKKLTFLIKKSNKSSKFLEISNKIPLTSVVLRNCNAVLLKNWTNSSWLFQFEATETSALPWLIAYSKVFSTKSLTFSEVKKFKSWELLLWSVKLGAYLLKKNVNMIKSLKFIKNH